MNTEKHFTWEQKILFCAIISTSEKLTKKQKKIIIALTMHNLPKIVVASFVDDMTTLELVNAVNAIKFGGDPDCTSPPKSETALKADAATLAALHASRETDKSLNLTDLEIETVGKLKEDYTEAANYVQTVARKVAKAHGDVAAGIAVVTRTGFHLKKKSEKPPRGFEVVDQGPGWFKLRVKSLGKKAGYVWRYGITTAKGTPPTVFSQDVFKLECEITIRNCKSGSIYGFQMAGVLPEKDPSISDGDAPLEFCDFIYAVCK